MAGSSGDAGLRCLLRGYKAVTAWSCPAPTRAARLGGLPMPLHPALEPGFIQASSQKYLSFERFFFHVTIIVLFGENIDRKTCFVLFTVSQGSRVSAFSQPVTLLIPERCSTFVTEQTSVHTYIHTGGQTRGCSRAYQNFSDKILVFFNNKTRYLAIQLGTVRRFKVNF